MIDFPPDITRAGKDLRQGIYSIVELTRHCLDGIKALQSKLNTMITVTSDQAMAEATRLDAELQQGIDRGPLHGIPYVNKDLFDVSGIRTTVGSPLFSNRIPVIDSEIVARLRRAGAVHLGQANMSEFAAVPTGRNLTYGDVQNPWKLGHTPGTSSSGSAAAVASGICLAATGSDTGNSIRSPASYCGVVGLRPTFGRVSLVGAFPRAQSLDTAGPIARTVRDVALLLQCIAGHDQDYPQTLVAPVPDYSQSLECGVYGLHVALVANFSLSFADEPVAEAVHRTLECLSVQGVKILEIRIPLLENHQLLSEALFDILLYEFNNVLRARYSETVNKSLFDPAVREDLARGNCIKPETYHKALVSRAERKAAVLKCFGDVDVIVTPTTPSTAPAYGAPTAEWERQRRFLLPVSYLGLPAISVPCGISPEGLPIGIQLIGRPLSEPLLLRVGEAVERSSIFTAYRPIVFWS